MKDIEKIDATHVIWQTETSEIQSKVEACHKVFNEPISNWFVLRISIGRVQLFVDKV